MWKYDLVVQRLVLNKTRDAKWKVPDKSFKAHQKAAAENVIEQHKWHTKGQCRPGGKFSAQTAACCQLTHSSTTCIYTAGYSGASELSVALKMTDVNIDGALWMLKCHRLMEVYFIPGGVKVNQSH